MNEGSITSAMKVSDIIQRYPETCEVFRSHGCPDMRKGFFALMARIMPIKWAARMHRIPVDALLRDLNAVAGPSGDER